MDATGSNFRSWNQNHVQILFANVLNLCVRLAISLLFDSRILRLGSRVSVQYGLQYVKIIGWPSVYLVLTPALSLTTSLLTIHFPAPGVYYICFIISFIFRNIKGHFPHA